jgi:anti-sigma factor RsiW
MIDRDSPVTDDELHAYVDGELPDDRRGAVEAWLASHPEDAALVAGWRLQAEVLRARYGGVANEPVPARLSLERLARSNRKWMGIAAAAVVLAFLAGGAAGWFGHGLVEGPRGSAKSLTAEAIDAYRLYAVEVRHPVEVPGAEEAHLVQWLSRRLNTEVRAPNLAAIGLKLVGGRLLPGPAGPAAFLMYEGSSGERFTIYCSRVRGAETALRYSAAGQVAAFYWIERDRAYVVSGPADRDRLLKVAQSAYDQLEGSRSSFAPASVPGSRENASTGQLLSRRGS